MLRIWETKMLRIWGAKLLRIWGAKMLRIWGASLLRIWGLGAKMLQINLIRILRTAIFSFEGGGGEVYHKWS